MSRDTAKIMLQHFIDAHLVENAIDPSINLIKDRSVYQPTHKGLHVLVGFIAVNGIFMNLEFLHHPARLAEPICMPPLYMKRRKEDDELIIAMQPVICSLFRRFAGRRPNMAQDRPKIDPNVRHANKGKGIQLFEFASGERTGSSGSRNGPQSWPWAHCFSAVAALDWLCDFSMVAGRDEAADIAAHFVRFGLITLVFDRHTEGNAVFFTVRGSPGPDVAVSAMDVI
jgi:hypothetical protein